MFLHWDSETKKNQNTGVLIYLLKIFFWSYLKIGYVKKIAYEFKFFKKTSGVSLKLNVSVTDKPTCATIIKFFNDTPAWSASLHSHRAFVAIGNTVTTTHWSVFSGANTWTDCWKKEANFFYVSIDQSST